MIKLKTFTTSNKELAPKKSTCIWFVKERQKMGNERAREKKWSQFQRYKISITQNTLNHLDR